jgi:hypothetical protein
MTCHVQDEQLKYWPADVQGLDTWGWVSLPPWQAWLSCSSTTLLDLNYFSAPSIPP